ncbi:ABC transporter permease [Paenibacillus validus]|uniref:ABC transporter permease subunit n=1 Tax=Paenibacillus validus TaxID=44253 RepID=A0A7X3CT57_9BACL|nr:MULTISPECIES: ABC transporter permease [Paenibacillus]MED4599775.1 ABC transporter permease [Paenibacillus validus]MED4604690.1 ABC transporter permease [Paenibacillus validus]MUG70674.1 ABC transporter permease subunit [Paenibacillus validus]
MGETRKHIKNRVAFLEQKVPGYASVAGIAALLIIWEIVCRLEWVSPLFLPSPTGIVAAGWELLTQGDLLQNTGASLYRIVLGYLLGASIGIVIGLLLGFSRWAEAMGTPILFSLYPIPKIALLPLIVLWLGIGELPKVTIIALGVFFPVVINTFSGVKNVDPILIKAAVSFGSNHMNVIRKVILPGALPVIFAGLKLAAGTSLLLLVAAEMIAAKQGIGSMILHYGNLMITTKLMVGVVVLSLLGLLFNRSLQWLENKLLPWK